jgi:hypothetical protein
MFTTEHNYMLRDLKAEPVLNIVLKCETRWIYHVDTLEREDFQSIKKVQVTWIKEPSMMTFGETFGQLKLEQTNKLPDSLTAR